MRVAIIGSGPGGFYAAEQLLKRTDVAADVDLFDRLPTPYGLVRGGVAPDHQKIKSVTRVFAGTAARPSFRFLGNVRLGTDLTVEDLRRHYHQVVYATGNEADRRLGIPGEGITRCTPATVFVGWYNGHPDYRAARFDFSVERVAVVGNGNVSVDVARILLRTPAELARTDMAAHAVEALRQSRVREVFLLGRRGPAQASFTPGELEELGKLEEADPVVDPADLEGLDEKDPNVVLHARSGRARSGSTSASCAPRPRCWPARTAAWPPWCWSGTGWRRVPTGRWRPAAPARPSGSRWAWCCRRWATPPTPSPACPTTRSGGSSPTRTGGWSTRRRAR
jgi:hypothetical protein